MEKMALLERVTDANYGTFINQENAVIILTLSYCEHCQDFKKEAVGPASERFPEVRFGEAVLDLGRLIRLKKDIVKSMPECYPTAIIYQKGVEITRVESSPGMAPTLEKLICTLSGVCRKS
jgi:hypothetical protein